MYYTLNFDAIESRNMPISIKELKKQLPRENEPIPSNYSHL